jgi:hypothetical protein
VSIDAMLNVLNLICRKITKPLFLESSLTTKLSNQKAKTSSKVGSCKILSAKQTTQKPQTIEIEVKNGFVCFTEAMRLQITQHFATPEELDKIIRASFSVSHNPKCFKLLALLGIHRTSNLREHQLTNINPKLIKSLAEILSKHGLIIKFIGEPNWEKLLPRNLTVQIFPIIGKEYSVLDPAKLRLNFYNNLTGTETTSKAKSQRLFGSSPGEISLPEIKYIRTRLEDYGRTFQTPYKKLRELLTRSEASVRFAVSSFDEMRDFFHLFNLDLEVIEFDPFQLLTRKTIDIEFQYQRGRTYRISSSESVTRKFLEAGVTKTQDSWEAYPHELTEAQADYLKFFLSQQLGPGSSPAKSVILELLLESPPSLTFRAAAIPGMQRALSALKINLIEINDSESTIC